MEYPTIINLNKTDIFQYFWLKYVRDVNLDHHCAKSLVGKYSTKVNNENRVSFNIELDEAEAKYYYLCGVAKPYRWENNYHLAFKYQKGSKIVKDNKGVSIVIRDAVEIPIIKQGVYEHSHGHLQAFNTCRNWQFAYQIKDYLDV